MSRKDKDIPAWQRSVFDSKPCVETKPITVSSIKQLEKDFYHKNKEMMKINDPKLYQFYKKEFSRKKQTATSLQSPNTTTTKSSDSKEQTKIPTVDEAVAGVSALDAYQRQRQRERSAALDLMKQQQQAPVSIKFKTFRKDPNRGMGWVSAHPAINTGKLGHSQSWKFKVEKKYRYYE